MKSYSLSLYDAFTEVAFGGSQAAVVLDAAALDAGHRAVIAREVGLPATAFVDGIGEDWVRVQFFSTVQELPMCGHGTICLMTHLVDEGLISPGPGIELRLPNSHACVDVDITPSTRYQVMLDISPARFEPAPMQIDSLLNALGLNRQVLAPDLPLEVAHGDFVHLVVPLNGLGAMRAIRPDFGAIVAWCHAHGVETIAAFCVETEVDDADLHVRDFCPAVGVSESAAAGTTNAALSAYLLRHKLLETIDTVDITAEQGLEIERPSRIRSRVELRHGGITRLQVGGIATRVFQGRIYP